MAEQTAAKTYEAINKGFAEMAIKFDELIAENVITHDSLTDNCGYDRLTALAVEKLLLHFGTKTRVSPSHGPTPETLLQVAFAHYTRAHADSDNCLAQLKTIAAAVSTDAVAPAIQLLTQTVSQMSDAVADLSKSVERFRRENGQQLSEIKIPLEFVPKLVDYVVILKDRLVDFADTTKEQLHPLPFVQSQTLALVNHMEDFRLETKGYIQTLTADIRFASNKSIGSFTGVHNLLEAILSRLPERADFDGHFQKGESNRQQLIRIRNILLDRLRYAEPVAPTP